MKKLDFNTDWVVFCEDRPEIAANVILPYDAMIHEQRDPDCANKHATGYYPGGIYHYRKTFTLPRDLKNQTLILEFEGVYQNSTVSVNGEQICTHPNGYTNFYINITDKVRFDRENIIDVIVDTTLPNSRWYSGSGIYRPVWLYVGNHTHIKPGGVSIQTKSIHPAVLHIRTETCGGIVHVQLMNGDQVIASSIGEDVFLTVPDAKLWSSEDPYLYTCHVSLFVQDKLVDETELSCGICKLEWDTRGLFINGKETKLRGACIHHDNGILGACDFADASVRKVAILKEAGFNAIRSAHNPISSSMLKACDQLGMYVVDEFSDMWYTHKNIGDYASYFDYFYEQDLTSMVRRDISHPSVILYSIGNEVTETCEVRGISVTNAMRQLIYRLDRTRPVTCGINMTLNVMHFAGMDIFHTGTMPNSPEKTPKGYAYMSELKQLQDSTSVKPAEGMSSSEFFNQMMRNTGNRMRRVVASEIAKAVSEDAYAALDIAGYNYGDGRYYLDQKDYPNRVSVGSETLPQDIVNNWKAVTDLPYLIGDFLWTGWDYLGEARIGSFCYESSGCLDNEYPALLAGCGVIDITGMPRPEVWLNRIAYGFEKGPVLSVEPVIHALEDVKCSAWRRFDSIRSWSWSGCEGYPVKLVIYANAAKVDVIRNGIHIGSVTPVNCTALLETTYAPGTLTAIAYDEFGQVIGTDTLTSASAENKITVTPSASTIWANGQDLCFLDIRLTDDASITKASSDRPFTVQVTGNAMLAGVGSADPFATMPYTGNKGQTYYGRAQAILRSGLEAGTAHILIQMDGCSPVQIDIAVSDRLDS